MVTTNHTNLLCFNSCRYVHFMCQIGATPYLVEYVDQSMRQCEYHINIKSEYACPACNDFDLTKVGYYYSYVRSPSPCYINRAFFADRGLV